MVRWLQALIGFIPLLSNPLHASTANGQILFRLGATSNLATPNITFPNLEGGILATHSYWSNSASWTFDSDDTNGYTVTVSNNAGAGVTHWTLTSGANNIDFILVTNRTITDTAATTITASPGLNTAAIGTLGGRQVTPNTTPNPDANILYEKVVLDAAEKTYVMYAAIAGSELLTPIEGTYTKQLTIDLTEGT